jgi:hypothetical protein
LKRQRPIEPEEQEQQDLLELLEPSAKRLHVQSEDDELLLLQQLEDERGSAVPTTVTDLVDDAVPAGPALAIEAGRLRESRRLHHLARMLANAMGAALTAGAAELTHNLESFLLVRGVVPPPSRVAGAPNPPALAANKIIRDARFLFNQQTGLMAALARRFCRVSPHLCFWLQEPETFPGSNVSDEAMAARVSAFDGPMDPEANPIRDKLNQIAAAPDGRYHPFATIAAILSFFFWVGCRMAVGTDRSGVDTYGDDTAERVVSTMLSDCTDGGPSPACNHHRKARCFLVSLLVSPYYYACLWEKFHNFMAAAVETRHVANHLWKDPSATQDVLDDAGFLDLLNPDLARWVRKDVEDTIRHRMSQLNRERQPPPESADDDPPSMENDTDGDPRTLLDRQYEYRNKEDVRLPPPYSYGKYPAHIDLPEETFALLQLREKIATDRQCARTLPLSDERRMHMMNRLRELLQRFDAPCIVNMVTEDGDSNAVVDVVGTSRPLADRTNRITIWGHSVQLPQKRKPAEPLTSAVESPRYGKCPKLLKRFLGMREREEEAEEEQEILPAAEPVPAPAPRKSSKACVAKPPPAAAATPSSEGVNGKQPSVAAAASITSSAGREDPSEAPAAAAVVPSTTSKKKRNPPAAAASSTPPPPPAAPKKVVAAAAAAAAAWTLTAVPGESPFARWTVHPLAIPSNAAPVVQGTAPVVEERCKTCSPPGKKLSHNGECGPCVRCRHKSIYKGNKVADKVAVLPKGSAAVSSDSVEAFLSTPTGRFVGAVLVAAERCGVRSSSVPSELSATLVKRIAAVVESVGWDSCQVQPDRLTGEHKALIGMFIGTGCHALSVPRILQCCNGCRDRRTMFCKFCVAAMGFAAPGLFQPMMAIVLPKYPRLAKNGPAASTADGKQEKIQKNGPHFPNVACSRRCMELLLRDAVVSGDKLGAIRPIHALYNAVVMQRFGKDGGGSGAAAQAKSAAVVATPVAANGQDGYQEEMELALPEDGDIGAWIEREDDLPDLPPDSDEEHEEELQQQQQDEQTLQPLPADSSESEDDDDCVLPVMGRAEDILPALPQESMANDDDDVLPLLNQMDEELHSVPYDYLHHETETMEENEDDALLPCLD